MNNDGFFSAFPILILARISSTMLTRYEEFNISVLCFIKSGALSIFYYYYPFYSLYVDAFYHVKKSQTSIELIKYFIFSIFILLLYRIALIF